MKNFIEKVVRKIAYESMRVADWIHFHKLRFNASIISYKGSLYIIARKNNASLTLSKLIQDGDGQYIAINEKQLKLSRDRDNLIIDGRLFISNNGLYCAYADIKMCGHACKQALAEIGVDGRVLSNKTFDSPLNIKEKNWSFFDYRGDIFFVYETGPNHVVMNKEMVIVGETVGVIWDYGEVRGGTSPILIGDKYVGVFHSALDTGKILDKYGNTKKIYYAGWYTFRATPPFEIVEFSKKPILIPEPNDGWHDVVFPCGLIKNEKGFLLSYGYQDREARIVQLDDKFNCVGESKTVVWKGILWPRRAK